MKQSIPQIKNVKFKTGEIVSVLPKSKSNFVRINFEWGEVTFRAFNNRKLTCADVNYMCEVAKDINMNG